LNEEDQCVVQESISGMGRCDLVDGMATNAYFTWKKLDGRSFTASFFSLLQLNHLVVGPHFRPHRANVRTPNQPNTTAMMRAGRTAEGTRHISISHIAGFSSLRKAWLAVSALLQHSRTLSYSI
jgi:hypothetical protein